MSIWTWGSEDLVVTQGMDLTVQWWVRDHRGENVPFENPSKFAAVDRTGQTLVELVGGSDPMTGSVLPSSSAGIVQLVVQRTVTATWDPGRYAYEVWATIVDPSAAGLFPNGQQVPVVSATLHVIRRVVHMEAAS